MPTLWRVTVLWPQRGTGPTLRLSRRGFDGAGTASNMPNEPAVKRRLDWLWHEFDIAGEFRGSYERRARRRANRECCVMAFGAPVNHSLRRMQSIAVAVST